MAAFPLSAWLIIVVPPVLMIGGLLVWYRSEAKKEKLEDELFAEK